MEVRNGEIILIDPSEGTGGQYPIGLDQCETPEAILSFVRHLCDKQWVTRKQIQFFVNAATEQHGINIDV
ncbi:hypothetical protein [Gimesia fumaroli]|uniref:Uncharacterized protein n=1 Tax=Gimesia fumaroli TaxID=2527976 RepID=A0A518ID49_9PLAN|nr:hypothetical protein [Gimesia fumaroli]QDV51005.1 hypothetical protein Enr17x_30560 [Gimesia fumaroli]